MSFTEFPIPTTPAAEFVRGESEATPTADKIVRAPAASQYLNPGWQTPHAVLLPEYEAVPAGYYDTGERVGTNKVVVNWELAQLYDYGEIDGSAADPDSSKTPGIYRNATADFAVNEVLPGEAAAWIRDDSQPLSFGPELLTETPDISVTTTAPTTWDPVTRVLEVLRDSAAGERFGISGLDAGKVYLFEAEGVEAVAGYSLDGPRVADSGSSGPLVLSTSRKQVLVSGDTGFFLQQAANGRGIRYTGVTFREVTGVHLPFVQTNSTQQGKYAEAPADIRNLLSGTDTLATQDVDVTAAEHTLSFKGTGSVTLSGVSTAGPLNGTGAEDIVSLTFTPTAGTLTLTVSGTVEDAQLELGDARTDYQSANADRTNITSATEPSFGQIRIDQVDDEYPITLANGLTNGTVIVAGRQGTWVEEGVNLSAGSTFTVGPTDVTGCPNDALFAVGNDVVGWSVIDKAMSEIEIRREVEYWKAKGAKGRLVEGPELLADPGFDDADEWSLPTGWEITGSQLIKEQGDDLGFAKTDAPTDEYAPWLVSYDISALDRNEGSGSFSIRNGTGDNLTGSVTTERTRTQVILTDWSGEFRAGANDTDLSFTLESVSLKRLTPEEDL